MPYSSRSGPRSTFYACGDGSTFSVTSSKEWAWQCLRRGLDVCVVEEVVESKLGETPLAIIKGKYNNRWWKLAACQDIR